MDDMHGRILFSVSLFIAGMVLVLPHWACSAHDMNDVLEKWSAQGRYIDVQGERIRVFQTGSGPDVFLIHGLPGVIEDWEAIIPELSKRYRVTAYDRPGHGFSSANDLKYDIQQNTDIAFLLIDKLKLVNPIVVGHSYGGSIAVSMAERNPSNVKAFVAVSPVTTGSGRPDLIFRILKTPIVGTVAMKLAKLVTGCDMIEEGVDKAFSPNEKNIPPGYVSSRCKIWGQPKAISTMAKEEMSMRPDVKAMMPHYKGIDKPLFIVHGEDDKEVPASDSEVLHEAVSGSRLMLLKNTGHMVQYAKPGELTGLIEEASKE